ncbi:DUF2924 domain-containing protein [Brevundimonas sp. NPDC092305]|uniref:DUF2924 domain-containing protein n=1 Tax=Brevundimonas sp. NPDC092305 TaxID=3363957 RepID=UPI003816F83D
MTDLETRIEAEVAALVPMGLEELREVWRKRYGPPPRLRSPQLLRLNLAWRIQADAFGGLDAETKRRLRRGGAGASAADRLQPGVRLMREWKGVPHEVIVEEGGYRYADRSYRSLSEIAREISGTRWNGPRFFGLREAEKARAA